MQSRHVVHSFPPIINAESEILILGSVPSVKSAQAGFYYMHPQNRFWRIMSAVTGEDLTSADNAIKTAALLKRRIALYDSVYECDIEGSSDSAVSNIVPADIPALISSAPIKKILCNGAFSYNTLTKAYPPLAAAAIKMPSTSPANASFSFDKLLRVWSDALS
jgi:hypoxanthine-DNA glycosylase